jgi:hypothetical protein
MPVALGIQWMNYFLLRGSEERWSHAESGLSGSSWSNTIETKTRLQ